MQRRAAEAAARFDETLGRRATARRSEVVAAISATDSSSDDETCDLSDLSELSLSDGEESDFYDDCLNVDNLDDGDRPARVPGGGQSIGLLRRMSLSQQSLTRASGASQSGPRIVSIFNTREEPTHIYNSDREASPLR